MGSLVGGVIGAITGPAAAHKAAGQQVAAIQQGLQFPTNVYNAAQGNFQPYIGAGQSALSSLLGFYGLPGGNAGGAIGAYNQFAGTPAYQFPLAQGNLALNRQLASAGLTNSGAALKDAIGYNQGYASQNLGSYLTGLGGIAGAGQQAAGQVGQIGTSLTPSILNAYGSIGNANAAGTIGAYNALTQGLGQILGSPTIGGSQPSAYSAGSPGLFGSPTGIGGSYLGQAASGVPGLFGGGSSYAALNPSLTQIGGGGGFGFGIPAGVLGL